MSKETIVSDRSIRDSENEVLRYRGVELEAESYRLFFENAPIGKAMTGVDGSFVRVNSALYDMLGYSTEELLSLKFVDITHPDDVLKSKEFLRALLAGECVAPMIEKRYLTKDGRYVWTTVTTKLQRNAEGEPLYFLTHIQDISDRKVVEEGLRASEEKFAAVFRSSPDAIFLTTVPEGRIMEVNTAATRMTGRPSEEMLGRTIDELDFWAHPAGREAYAALIRRDGRVLDFDTRFRVKSGAVIDGMISGEIIRLKDGPCLLNVIRDIRERKKLQASEIRYRRLFESAKDGILILDAESGRVVEVNPFLINLLGYSHDEFKGKCIWDLGPFRDIIASKDAFLELQLKEYVRYEDLPLETRDGLGINVEFVSNVYLVEQTKVIQCNIRDITARKQGEAERERLNMAIEQVAEMIVVTDDKGNIQYTNPAFETTTGYTHVEVFGKNPRILKSGKQDAAFYRTLWGTVSSGRTWQGRFVNRKKDGTYYTEDATISPVRDAAGVNAGYVAVKRDITHELNLEAQLLQSHRMEGIGRLAGGVAHDFNNLLSVILSYTEYAMQGLREGDPFYDDLIEVKTAGRRAAALTRQLLAFSRKQLLQPVPLCLNQIAEGVEKMLRRILGEDIDLVQVLAKDLGVILADPSQMEQVLMNLVVNARDAMPEGGKLTIETSNVEIDEDYMAHHVAVKPGPYVQLTVTDTGGGMDEQTKARVFEPFFTTKETGRGTGLGLSSVYGIVKQSGGNIWLYSELGQGSTFKVYLPRDMNAAAMISNPPSLPRQSNGTETILVVEDEEVLRRVARRSIEEAGYTVLTAANGDKALQASAQYSGVIHLLLTDVVMPRMSGRTLAQQLIKTRPELIVLYMSGYTDETISHHGVLDAGTNFIGKPFTPTDLTWKVRQVLDKRAADRADKQADVSNADAEMPAQPLDEAELGAFPSDDLGRLLEAVIAGRFDEIVEIIETFRVTDPNVAARLQQMAYLFDYDGLRGLLTRWKKEGFSGK